MQMGSVYVKGPAGEKVYINGNYAVPAGQTNTTYPTDYGKNIFETLDEDGDVLLQALALVDENNQSVEVELQPVDQVAAEETAAEAAAEEQGGGSEDW